MSTQRSLGFGLFFPRANSNLRTSLSSARIGVCRRFFGASRDLPLGASSTHTGLAELRLPNTCQSTGRELNRRAPAGLVVRRAVGHGAVVGLAAQGAAVFCQWCGWGGVHGGLVGRHSSQRCRLEWRGGGIVMKRCHGVLQRPVREIEPSLHSMGMGSCAGCRGGLGVPALAEALLPIWPVAACR